MSRMRSLSKYGCAIPGVVIPGLALAFSTAFAAEPQTRVTIPLQQPRAVPVAAPASVAPPTAPTAPARPTPPLTTPTKPPPVTTAKAAQIPPAQAAALVKAVADAQGIKRLAVLRGLDKVTGRATDLLAPAGVPVKFGSLSINVRYCHTVPPEEPPETTAFVQVDDIDTQNRSKRIFSGWMFASSPALNAVEHAIYDVWVITCRTDAPDTVAVPPEELPPLPPTP